jgi:hypothetical protein
MTTRFQQLTRSLVGVVGAVLLATTCLVAATGPAQVATAQTSGQPSASVYLAA